ncbi:MAG TPA: LysR family transcriptional regulator [Terriglobales bacterium]|nr:LysR family transcriptional regulator [Terriglobales bacterium]
MYPGIDELHSFVVLAGELHFGRASKRLFVSQPALSRQIRKLEEKVGGPLFTRTRRKVEITEAGRVLLSGAEKVLPDAEAALSLAKDAAAGRAGTLRIGFGIASVSELLPRTILRFRRTYSQVELKMRDMSTPAQIAALVEGNIDIGIVRLPIFHAELDSWPLFHERLVLATSRSLPYHRRHGLAALRDQPFVFFPRATSATLHDHVLGLCRRAGFTPMIVQEASELFTILNLVRAGLGVSLVPSAARRMGVPGVRFHELGLPEAKWQIGIALNRFSDKVELISRFVATMRAVVRSEKVSAISR